MFRFPWGDMHSLNLGWFLQKFNELREDWATAEAGIDGALDAEIQRAEDALSDVFDARDAAAASATAAAGSASAANTSKTAAQNSATAAASSATLANQKASAAGLSEAAAGQSATAASNSASAAATSATQAGNSAAAAQSSAAAAAASEAHIEEIIEDATSEAIASATGTATTAATNAANSATAAAGSESNAAGSAAAAASSASDAAGSAADAAASAAALTTVPINGGGLPFISPENTSIANGVIQKNGCMIKINGTRPSSLNIDLYKLKSVSAISGAESIAPTNAPQRTLFLMQAYGKITTRVSSEEDLSIGLYSAENVTVSRITVPRSAVDETGFVAMASGTILPAETMANVRKIVLQLRSSVYENFFINVNLIPLGDSASLSLSNIRDNDEIRESALESGVAVERE